MMEAYCVNFAPILGNDWTRMYRKKEAVILAIDLGSYSICQIVLTQSLKYTDLISIIPLAIL